MNWCKVLPLAAFWLAAQAVAGEVSPAMPLVGDCAIFRESGGGRVVKAPTYWLRGSIAAISVERRLAGRCPRIGKPQAAYQRDDWVRIAASTPCVQTDAEIREVDVVRIHLKVDEWETPWSFSHGTTGWLFRGYFLDKALQKGIVLDMDSSWLERCELRP